MAAMVALLQLPLMRRVLWVLQVLQLSHMARQMELLTVELLTVELLPRKNQITQDPRSEIHDSGSMPAHVRKYKAHTCRELHICVVYQQRQAVEDRRRTRARARHVHESRQTVPMHVHHIHKGTQCVDKHCT